MVSDGCSAEKTALLHDLQEQGAVYMSEMMASLCSSLPYSDSTIKDLVRVISLHLQRTKWLMHTCI